MGNFWARCQLPFMRSADLHRWDICSHINIEKHLWLIIPPFFRKRQKRQKR
jgi:hypothetical protein